MTNGGMNLPSADAPWRREKIGGWLYFPAFGFIAGCINLAILLLAGIVLVIVPTDLDADPKAHKLREVFAAYVGFEAVLLAFLVYAMVRFFGKKRNAPAAIIAFLIAQVVVNGLMTAIFFLADSDYSITRNASKLAQSTAMAFAGSVLAAVFWIPYFRVSKRVKRTFVLD